MTTKTIYVVTMGNYSDYHIEAMFDNEEDALTLIEYLNQQHQYDDARLEEWPLNNYDLSKVREGLFYYSFHVKNSGEITLYTSDLGNNEFIWHQAYQKGQTTDQWVLYGSIWAKSEEHATKIVSDKVTQILAMNLWGKPEALEMFFK